MGVRQSNTRRHFFLEIALPEERKMPLLGKSGQVFEVVGH
jgi:hypothetical protein